MALTIACAPAMGISLREEIDLGKKIDSEILKQYALTNDEEALRQINEYGEKLIQGVWRPEIKYHFRILKDDQMNAFATPGGYVYFTERLWNTLREDERIGVLAHEIAHTDRRHALDAISKQQRRRLWMAVILTAVGASRIWGDVAGLAESLYTLKYSRGDEQQADEVGVELCEKAGYNAAGLLMAMRKIQRFQTEAGGEPPKIFSSHPPTRERLDYLRNLLVGKGVEIPPEDVVDEANPHLIGTVTVVDGRVVQFTHTEPRANDDIVWLMRPGWDFYYEKRTSVPIARGVVTGSTGNDTLTAETWPMPYARKGDIAAGVGVYAPPTPDIGQSVGTVHQLDPEAPTVGRLESAERLLALDRLLARQVVWNDDRTVLVTDNVGYLVVLDPANEVGFVAAQRGKYAYAPVAAGSALTRFSDPDQDRWVGPIVSIGRGGRTVEVLPNRLLSAEKTYEIAYPAWDPSDSYRTRVVGTAGFAPEGGKMVLKMTGFRNGWSIERIRNAFDVYEAADAADEDVPEAEDGSEDTEAEPAPG